MTCDEISPAGEAPAIPVVRGTPDDFDFFAGDWKIRNRRLRGILRGSDEWYENPGTVSKCKIVGGLGNVDDFRMTTADGEFFKDTDAYRIELTDFRQR